MKRQRTSAFSLVEVTLALGIAGFSLVAILGLMPVGVQTNRNATSQTAATNIMAAVVSDLRATPKTSDTSTQFGIAGLNTGANPPPLYFDSAGQVSTSLTANSRYQLNVTWSGSTGLRYADVKMTWPAAATLANASGSTEMFVAFDRN
jgi:uncharacterized protein (TIGR02598 family)